MKYDEKATDDLSAIKSALEDDIISIRHQVEKAKMHAAMNGIYSDVDWLANAKYALRKKGQQHQRIIQELAKRRKLNKTLKSESLCQSFVDVVRAHVSSETFASFMKEARERQGECD